MAGVLIDAEEQYAAHVPFHRTLAEIETAYAGSVSARVDGVLELIVRRPAEREREVVDAAELTRAEGLVGDSWVSRRSKSTPDGAPDPLRQLTIMNARALDAVAGSPDRWRLAGDQLIVSLDLSVENLPAGSRLRIGDAEVEVSKPPHVGCEKFSGRFGLDALRFVSTRDGKAQRRRGLNAQVVRPGLIRRGDAVVKL
jgi:MOSC domain-containing protein YiiM